MSGTEAAPLRDHFLGWQCRIRQIAMREHGGRPSPGMRPRVLAASGAEIAAALTVLIIPKEPAESTAFFRFQVQKSSDPRDVYERGLAFLQAEFFQQPGTFSDRLIAALPADSPVATALLETGTCILEFEQFRQSYRLICTVARLPDGDPARQAAIWHNRLFNPALPDDVLTLSFEPDWGSSEAEPAVPAADRQ
jgi:hypothetical protein